MQPVLVVMAAGLGSRYGGLKQMDAIGSNGEWMIDYSLYDAYQAGFRQVVFVVRESILEDFQELLGSRIQGKLKASYAVQQVDDLPEGFALPNGRVKPWGTAHAVYSARRQIGQHPFMVINADDYYGQDAFVGIYNHLKNPESPTQLSMIGYELRNTVTQHGTVSRGVCRVSDSGELEEIVERTKICAEDGRIAYENASGWVPLAGDTPVSLNCWGFQPLVMEAMETQFQEFLSTQARENPLTAEFYLPSVVEQLLAERKATVKVIPSQDRWYGVTYREDKRQVSKALDDLKTQGLYPQDLWA